MLMLRWGVKESRRWCVKVGDYFFFFFFFFGGGVLWWEGVCVGKGKGTVLEERDEGKTACCRRLIG